MPRVVDIIAFLGQATTLDPMLLPDGVGTVSLNQRPGFADLRPWNLPGAAVATRSA